MCTGHVCNTFSFHPNAFRACVMKVIFREDPSKFKKTGGQKPTACRHAHLGCDLKVQKSKDARAGRGVGSEEAETARGGMGRVMQR